MAQQIDTGYRVSFQAELLTDEVMQRVRDMVIEKLRAAERAQLVRDVDDLLDQVKVERHPQVAGRIVVAVPDKLVSPLHQAAFVHTMYL